MTTEIDAKTIAYERQGAILSASLGPEEIALLDPSREFYFGLEGPAARIWELLAEPRSLDDLCRILVQEYEVHEEECRHDVRQHLAELLQRKLITSSERSAA